MDEAIHERKRALRRTMRVWLRKLTLEEVRRRSERLCATVLGTRAYREARTVMAFLPIPGEPDLSGVIERAFADGKRVCLPRAEWDAGTMEAILVAGPGYAVRTGRHGVIEPDGDERAVPGSIDLVLVPGLAFDRAGVRLGRGAGFYDRFLRDCAGLRLGVAFGEQVAEAVPRQPHDELVHAIATESGVIVCDAARWRT
ncbi:MAG: 5-formyltetrahydrofolate cyclo-ligase [Phycisphaeraceae bacterium]|nr:MAG: 5-formyltetrahydrofolate cyclo-ligase [Phycisphaeraceae bacterium]